MNHITLTLTVEELRLLTTLASDQLFRREFIDPKMPGYKANPEEMASAKGLVGRLRLMLGQISQDAASGPADLARSALGSPSKRHDGLPDAL